MTAAKPKRTAAKKASGKSRAASKAKAPKKTAAKVDRGVEAKPAPRPKRKSKISVAKIAEMRRKGATWAEVVEATGLKLKSTGFGKLLAEAGYDRAGRKGGQGASKAVAFGPSLLNR
ncbi:MAG: hypothetical protein ACRDMH_02825 [Solirubrobacterales bacterium]